MSYSSVNDFVSKLEQNAPGAKNFEKQRKLEKIYLNVPVNFGRYQVLPLPSVVTGYPYVELPYTREINIPIKNIKSDGTEVVYNGWIKLLPTRAYTVRDETGRETSSLTAANEALLQKAYTIHEELCKELDFKNNAIDPVIGKLLRKKNYTLFHAYCVNKWSIDNIRVPERQNFSALFVATSRKFSESLSENISQFSLVSADSVPEGWLNQIYNRELTGRTGFLMFSVQKNATAPGFAFSASHAINKGEYLKDISIDKEDMDLMSDPIETFLGWQCPRDINSKPVGQRCLFNEELINKAINFMSQQLAAIRITKQNGGDVNAAIAATNEEVLKNQVPTNTMGQTTNDPMLAQMADKAASMNRGQNIPNNPQSVVNKNTDPFSNPPAAHIDPITASPVNNNTGAAEGWGNNNGQQQQQQQAPFNKPAFSSFSAGFGGTQPDNGDLPF